MLLSALRFQCRGTAAISVPRIAPIASSSALTFADVPPSLLHVTSIKQRLASTRLPQCTFSTSSSRDYANQEPFQLNYQRAINKKRLRKARLMATQRLEREKQEAEKGPFNFGLKNELVELAEENTPDASSNVKEEGSPKKLDVPPSKAHKPRMLDGMQALTHIPFTSDSPYHKTNVPPPTNTLGRSSELPISVEKPVFSSVLAVASLLPTATEEDLRELFSKYGEIVEILMPTSSSGQSKGIAHVRFRTPQPAQQILIEHEQLPFELHEHTLDLSISRKNERMSRAVKATLFVGNLPFHVKKEDIHDVFRDVIDVIDVTHGCGERGGTQGYAHVGLSSQEDLDTVLSMHREVPFELKGRVLRLAEAIMGDKNPSWDPDPKRKSFRRSPEPRRVLFVTGFDVRDTEGVIKEAFSVYGAVHDVELLYAPSGISRGIGYITFKSIDDAMAVRKAHEEDPITFNKVALNIEYALPKDYESNTPYKVLYVRRLRGGKRELKWYFFSHNRHIRKMMVHKQAVETEFKTAMVVFKDVKYAITAKEALDGWREEDNTVPEVYYGLPSQYERSIWRQEEEQLFGIYKGNRERAGVYGLRDKTVLAQRNYRTHPKADNEPGSAYRRFQSSRNGYRD